MNSVKKSFNCSADLDFKIKQYCKNHPGMSESLVFTWGLRAWLDNPVMMVSSRSVVLSDVMLDVAPILDELFTFDQNLE